MQVFDVHSHRNFGENVIHNPEISSAEEFLKIHKNQKISLGVHPWETFENWQEKFAVVEKLAASEQVVAIGECGLDRLKGADFLAQTEVFLRHVSLSEKLQKPLIIHCVRAFEEIALLKKQISPRQKWILHGFRAKPQTAQKLLALGFHFSIGEKFNAQTAKILPNEKLFFETDYSSKTIEEIFQNFQTAKNA